MNILGISCYFHDAAAALLRDGMLIAAAEEERFSRVKHDYSFPHGAINFCLKRGGLTGPDLDYVVFFEKPFVKFDRILQTTLATVPRSAALFSKAMTTWLLDKLWIKTLIRNTLRVSEDRILFVDHHDSHAASAYLCSPFDQAAILTVDGVGEWTTTALGRGRGSTLDLTAEVRFPHSLGLLYSTFTAFLGFEINEGEYKVMGMAPYGRPRYLDDVRRVIRTAADGSFWLDMDYFSFHYSATNTYSDKFVRLFGPPRDARVPFFTCSSNYSEEYGPKPGNFDQLASDNQRFADIAASVQVVTEELVLGFARAAHERTGLTQLCMAGGVALNSVANGRILRETAITDLYIQPAAGDSGAALGAALYAAHVVLGEPRRFVMSHAYWGESHDDASVRAAVTASGLAAVEYSSADILVDRTSDLLSSGKVIGWIQGSFEWGPRALGNRSILADPRRLEMKDVVNRKIKFRESFRPFAPSVTDDDAHEYFVLDQPTRQMPARFMQIVTQVKENMRDRVPAVIHVDGSARPQIVFCDSNPLYHSLITQFGHATGVPVLLNTSCNLRGEPIVNTPDEALSTFSRSGMDALVMNSTIITKQT